MTEKETDGLLLPGQYIAPNSERSVIDTETSVVKDFKSLTILEQIKLAAKNYNIPINDKPKKNCQKCYERGYTGIDHKDKTPSACPCMFPKNKTPQLTKEMLPTHMISGRDKQIIEKQRLKRIRKELMKSGTLDRLKTMLVKEQKLLKESETNNGKTVEGPSLG